MDQTRHIVAAVDQFPQDDPVLARAAQIAHTHAAKLTIVHVIDGFGSCDSRFPDLNTKLMQQQLQCIARQSIEAALARQKISLVEIDICIKSGSPSQCLIDLSDEMKLDLIVMRAHQSDSILEKIIGSTTDRVVRASCAPVLVVKRPVMHAYQRVVVSIDTTDGSIALVSYIARLLPRVKLSLLHVVQIPPQFEAAMLQAGSGHSIAAYREDLVDKAKTLLHEQSQKLDQSAITSTVRVVAGEPATTLVQATWNPKVGLIVLGPGSTGKIRRALLGSVTQRVLRNAACDVLICRTDQLEERE